MPKHAAKHRGRMVQLKPEKYLLHANEEAHGVGEARGRAAQKARTEGEGDKAWNQRLGKHVHVTRQIKPQHVQPVNSLLSTNISRSPSSHHELSGAWLPSHAEFLHPPSRTHGNEMCNDIRRYSSAPRCLCTRLCVLERYIGAKQWSSNRSTGIFCARAFSADCIFADSGFSTISWNSRSMFTAWEGAWKWRGTTRKDVMDQ
jgi:hypothetical protein